MRALATIAVSTLLLGALAGCPPRIWVRTYPRWTLAATTWTHDCAIANAYVRRSGKEGMGVTLALRSRFDCALQVTRVELVFPDGGRATATPPVIAPLHGRSLVYAWIALPFDGDAAWDRDARQATLEIDFTIAGQPAPSWHLPATLQWGERWTNQYAVHR